MSVEIAWKQNILVTDFHLLKSLLVVLGFGSQAFVCGFSRQNINSVVCDCYAHFRRHIRISQRVASTTDTTCYNTSFWGATLYSIVTTTLRSESLFTSLADRTLLEFTDLVETFIQIITARRYDKAELSCAIFHSYVTLPSLFTKVEFTQHYIRLIYCLPKYYAPYFY